MSTSDLLPPTPRRLRRIVGPGGLVLAVMLLAAGEVSGATAATAVPVDFNREVRPILSENCFACHGPDSAARAKTKTDLRLDTRDGLFAKVDDIVPVVPGDPTHSAILKRVSTKDDDDHMPPAKTGKTLTTAQITTLTRWISEGAHWQPHWAFIVPTMPAVPQITDRAWAATPIDHFIAARLEREGLKPAPEADRATLLRRVSLDLIGLPPTRAELDAFLADTSTDAYARVVDRLLASPHYGERMALGWLDGARYGDSNGHQADFERYMWRWRDWVIDAFNRNEPFDQFTIEQIAGDLLPDATLDNRIATGFNRNHRMNDEGGAISEEWRIENVIDRVDTTSQVWLGLTMGCARCHDHKYDPIAQKDFYRFFAFFNNVPEDGVIPQQLGNLKPFISAPRPQDLVRMRELTAKLEAAKAEQVICEKAFAAKRETFERRLLDEAVDVDGGLIARFPLTSDAADQRGTWPAGTWRGGTSTFSEQGIFASSADFDSNRFIEIGTGAEGPRFDRTDRFSYGGWVKRSGDGVMTLMSRMEDDQHFRGFSVFLINGTVGADLIDTWPDNALKVNARQAIPDAVWTHVFVTYDGSAHSQGLRIYLNGSEVPTTSEADHLQGSPIAHQPLRLGAHQNGSRLKGQLRDVRIYDRQLTAAEVGRLALLPLADIARRAVAERTPAQAAALLQHLIDHYSGEVADAHRQVDEAQKQVDDFSNHLPTVMVMEEMKEPRTAHVLLRGVWDKPGDAVEPGTPKQFPPMKPEWPANRLGLARWIASTDNPLTARVAVNRLWERFFGIGLVKTTENLGSQAELPSNPELLDWLACEFMRQGWDLKAIQKTMVLSTTYRQNSAVSAELLARDPENRLLARGPYQRLPAELLRDQALVVAGLLVPTIGGPSVRPYQPKGVWDETGVGGNLHNYQNDHGDDLYRRTIYTILKRNAMPPNLLVFDMPNRASCVVRRSVTNTPLQALDLMNDPTFVEAARVLAQHMMSEGGTTVPSRITLGFRLATARCPEPAELDVLTAGFTRRLKHYRSDAAAASAIISQGEKPVDTHLDAAELAAYTTVANAILNLDEVITKH